MNKTYLGDGVYVEIQEIQESTTMLKLTTSNGIEDTNTIFLEPEIVDALKIWMDKYYL